MNCFIITDSKRIISMMDRPSPNDPEFIFLTPEPRLSRHIKRKGFKSFSGNLNKKNIYTRSAVSRESNTILCLLDPDLLRKAVGTIYSLYPDIEPLILLGTEDREFKETLKGEFSGYDVRILDEFIKAPFSLEIKKMETKKIVRRYREYFEGVDRILILLHNEPDPDSIASALALRHILGRNKSNAPIASLTGVTRPENSRMLHLLGIEVLRISKEEIPGYPWIALVDIQPDFFEGILTHADLVIDHHPKNHRIPVRIEDIRPQVGATATIMTEHLLATHMSIPERLSTALLYAIKTDTQFLSRGVTSEDIEAFATLFSLANRSLVRRIEGGSLSMEYLGYIERALHNYNLEGGLFYAHLDRAEREDIITYLADFFLQLEETQWTAVSGIVEGELVISLRNLGYQKDAGNVAKESFKDIGNAGGHKSLAKARIPLKELQKIANGVNKDKVSQVLWKRLSRSILS